METLEELLNGAQSVKICNEGGQFGTLTLNEGSGSLTYTPNRIMTANDNFTVHVVQSNGKRAKAEISIKPADPIFYGPEFFKFNDVAGSSIIDVNTDLPAAHLDGDAVGQSVSFEFVGTGLQLYCDATEQSGAVVVRVDTLDGKLKKLVWLDLTNRGKAPDAICAPILARLTWFNYGAYICQITRVKTTDEAGETELSLPVNIRGLRVAGTDDESQTIFIPARDIIPKTVETDASSEVIVAAGETVNFTINTLGSVSLSMRAAWDGTPVTLSVTVDDDDGGINSVTELIDQFYSLIEETGETREHTIKISVAEDSAGSLGLVSFKIDGDANTTINGEIEDAVAESDAGE